ncbi:hypothetical protein CEUSTIGMA_g13891.t1, partial [Chlamydomonas eustigma]
MGTKLSWAYIGYANTSGRCRLVIYASQLAACAGMNPFTDRHDMQLELQHAMFGTDHVPPDYIPPKKRSDIVDVLPIEAKAALDVALKTMTGDDPVSVQTACAEVKKAMPEIKKEELDAVRTLLNAQHGNVGEPEIRRRFEAATGVFVNQDSKFLSSKCLFKTGPFDVCVGGKHDGIVGDTVTEIKNRMRKFK